MNKCFRFLFWLGVALLLLSYFVYVNYRLLEPCLDNLEELVTEKEDSVAFTEQCHRHLSIVLMVNILFFTFLCLLALMFKIRKENYNKSSHPKGSSGQYLAPNSATFL